VRITTSAKRIIYILCTLSIACTFMLSACSNNAVTAKEGDTVKVLYVGTLDDGTVFDSSELHGGDPLQFTIGAHTVIAGFEQAVVNMSVNQSRTVNIPFVDAYGPHYDNRTATLEWSQFQNISTPTVGEVIPVGNSYGQTLNGTILNISDAGVTVDANLLLAGKNLTFNITLVEIIKAK